VGNAPKLFVAIAFGDHIVHSFVEITFSLPRIGGAAFAVIVSVSAAGTGIFVGVKEQFVDVSTINSTEYFTPLIDTPDQVILSFAGSGAAHPVKAAGA
jgi:hypothetical protein